MKNNQIINPTSDESARSLHKIRLPYLYSVKHKNDIYKNQGYKYTGKIYKTVTSPELWANPIQISLIGQLEVLITYIIEETKMIKKWFAIALNKNDLNIN